MRVAPAETGVERTRVGAAGRTTTVANVLTDCPPSETTTGIVTTPEKVFEGVTTTFCPSM
jgi:hypothetical protein